MLCQVLTVNFGGNAEMVTNGKYLQIKEVKIEAVPNAQNKNAKRRILDKKISVPVRTVFCTALEDVSKL